MLSKKEERIKEQRIVVIRNENLFENDYFNGFREKDEADYKSRILTNFEIMRRGSSEELPNHPLGNAELDTRFKQTIPHCAIFNPESKEILVYKRSNLNTEKRLIGRWSLDFRGHIEERDITGENFIENSMRIELRKEILLKGIINKVELLGYINNENNPVGKVHFGIAYLLHTTAREVIPLDKTVSEIRFLSLKKIEELCSSEYVESWSRIILEEKLRNL
ncbi:MAG: hypothetical protein QXU40_00260 [Candidatus Pacearchaeota archaeon]